MLFFPNAKINIGLNILRKRPDGYHDISSCFYPIALRDALEIIPAASNTFFTSGQGIESDAPNLVSKALELLSKDYQIPPVSIFLLKGIPIGAGLGGGSADAAFTISSLNQMFQLGIGIPEQESYARKLGSDCAFFIQNKPVYCVEKGDIFLPINLSLKGYSLLLINPGIHVSTADAYSGIIPCESAVDLRTVLQQPVVSWKETVSNDFEKTVFAKHPILSDIKQTLYDMGAEYASMSGSGSSIFGIFKERPSIDNNLRKFFVWQGLLN